MPAVVPRVSVFTTSSSRGQIDGDEDRGSDDVAASRLVTDASPQHPMQVPHLAEAESNSSGKAERQDSAYVGGGFHWARSCMLERGGSTSSPPEMYALRSTARMNVRPSHFLATIFPAAMSW